MTKNLKNNDNVLTDVEYANSIDILSKIVKVCVFNTNKNHAEKLNTHLQLIASADSLILTDPGFLYGNTKSISSDAVLVKFYKQLEHLFFSTRTNGYPDFYVRLCNNLAAGFSKQSNTGYSIVTKGGILDLANQLYKKSFLEHFVKPTPQKVLRVFLMNHSHLVLQLLISQFYQHENASKVPAVA